MKLLSAGCMNVTELQLTLKIISRHIIRHLERHFVCVLRIKWGKTSAEQHSISKTRTKRRSSWRVAWQEVILSVNKVKWRSCNRHKTSNIAIIKHCCKYSSFQLAQLPSELFGKQFTKFHFTRNNYNAFAFHDIPTGSKVIKGLSSPRNELYCLCGILLWTLSYFCVCQNRVRTAESAWTCCPTTDASVRLGSEVATVTRTLTNAPLSLASTAPRALTTSTRMFVAVRPDSVACVAMSTTTTAHQGLLIPNTFSIYYYQCRSSVSLEFSGTLSAWSGAWQF